MENKAYTVDAMKLIIERRRKMSFFPSFQRSLEGLLELIEDRGLRISDHRIDEAKAVLKAYSESQEEQTPGWPS